MGLIKRQFRLPFDQGSEESFKPTLQSLAADLPGQLTKSGSHTSRFQARSRFTNFLGASHILRETFRHPSRSASCPVQTSVVDRTATCDPVEPCFPLAYLVVQEPQHIPGIIANEPFLFGHG